MRVRVSRDQSSWNGVRRSTSATAAVCAAALLAGQGCGAVFGLFSGQKSVIDHAFARAVAFLSIALLGGLAAAVAYRWLAIKLRR
jgi:hypothetical protein